MLFGQKSVSAGRIRSLLGIVYCCYYTLRSTRHTVANMQTARFCATTQMLMLGLFSLTVASSSFTNKTHMRSAREAVDPSQVCARKSSDSRFIANAGVFGRILCDATTEGGGWIVILRRFNGRENFYRSWAEYVAGFGNVTDEFWMGNFNVNLLTSSGHFDLRVDMKFQRKTYYAKYSSFKLATENDNYRLHIAEFIGGDAGDSLSYHNNSDFSTIDRDNNRHALGGNCVMFARAPWWYRLCDKCLLFGQWNGVGSGKGVTWSTLTGHDKSLEFVEMKIRMNTQWY